MGQRERMNCATNDWEAAPWDASDEIADRQLRGFRERSAKAVRWTAVRDLPSHERDLFWKISPDVVYFAEHDGEQLLLLQLAWHGFPDPPEWGLASRAIGGEATRWSEWGYFAHLPEAWVVPEPPSPT